jgi:hypothetical protein
VTVSLFADSPVDDENDADEQRVAAMMLQPDVLDLEAIRSLIASMWQLHLSERNWLDRIYDYVKGQRGRPEVPEGASDEVKMLARLSVKNVLALVRDSFAQNLSVVGYRTATAKEDDPAWDMWQRNTMDARQAEVYRPALTYGVSYVTVTPSDHGPVFRPRSPRQILAVYDDPTLDQWPQYALETWITQKDAKPHRKGVLYDDTYMHCLDLGCVAVGDASIEMDRLSRPINVVEVEDIMAHGATFEGEPVCPVVRFVNSRDADDMIVGEVAPLILLQQAINSVNFDRLIVSRFGANPQRVITGWAGSKSEVLKASAMRIWTFEDPDVKAQAFPAASVEPYNSILEEMLQHVAMVAQISPSQVTGKLVNVSAEALAAAEANQQRKLAAKRESFGESWEQVLKLGAEMAGAAPESAQETVANPGAEVVWRDTEARSFAAVVDGVTKLAAAGVPIDQLLTLVPGMTQQQIQGIKEAMRGSQVSSLVDRLLANPAQATPTPTAPNMPGTPNAMPMTMDRNVGSSGS